MTAMKVYMIPFPNTIKDCIIKGLIQWWLNPGVILRVKLGSFRPYLINNKVFIPIKSPHLSTVIILHEKRREIQIFEMMKN